MNETITWSPGVTLEEIEKQVILKAFRFYRGNKTTTSHALGISIRTLDNKLEKYETEGKEHYEREAHQRVEREKFLARQRGNVQTSSQTGANVLGPLAGIYLEPAIETSAQSEMPMPKRREVQTVLPQHASASSQKRSR